MSSDVTRLLGLLEGYRATCVIAAALETGVLDRLARGDGCDDEGIAREVGAHAGSVARLVVGLRALGLVDGERRLTASGRLLVGELRPWASLTVGEYLPAWAQLAHAVRTGETGFARAFGMKAWEHRVAHAELGAAFDRVMCVAQARAAGALLGAYDFTAARRVVDVGGGKGMLLAAILKRNAAARGVLVDRPEVVAGVVLDRVEVVGGSFFDELPAGDVVILKHCLHNWGDEDCVRILGRCAEAVGETGVLLVLEDVLPEEPGLALVMMDLHMMAVQGGRERTRAELEGLLRRAGLRMERVVETRAGAPEVIEARRA